MAIQYALSDSCPVPPGADGAPPVDDTAAWLALIVAFGRPTAAALWRAFAPAIELPTLEYPLPRADVARSAVAIANPRLWRRSLRIANLSAVATVRYGHGKSIGVNPTDPGAPIFPLSIETFDGGEWTQTLYAITQAGAAQDATVAVTESVVEPPPWLQGG